MVGYDMESVLPAALAGPSICQTPIQLPFDQPPFQPHAIVGLRLVLSKLWESVHVWAACQTGFGVPTLLKKTRRRFSALFFK